MKWLSLWCALGCGCGLVNTNMYTYQYSPEMPFEFWPQLGDKMLPGSLPTATCTPGENPDPCGMVSLAGAPPMQCDPMGRCVATSDVILSYQVDAMQANLPQAVVQYGVDRVNIDKVPYWINNNTVGSPVPPTHLYVASASASGLDSSAQEVGVIGALATNSLDCSDPVDAAGDPNATGGRVCDLPVTVVGQAALAGRWKDLVDRQTPFKLFTRTTVTLQGGTPFPAGVVYMIRPKLTFVVAK